MTHPFLDTDVIIRLVSGDDLAKQAAAASLFREIAAGNVTVMAPVTVIADAVHILASPRLYALPRFQVSALLTPLVRLPGFRVNERRDVLRALELYGNTRLDFGDALIVAAMEHAGSQTLYSYDRHFDGIPGIRRREPTP